MESSLNTQKLQKAGKISYTQFTLTLFIRGFFLKQNQSWLSCDTVTVLVAYDPYLVQDVNKINISRKIRIFETVIFGSDRILNVKLHLKNSLSFKTYNSSIYTYISKIHSLPQSQYFTQDSDAFTQRYVMSSHHPHYHQNDQSYIGVKLFGYAIACKID